MLITTSSDGYLAFWHATSGKCIMSVREENGADYYCSDYRDDGLQVAVAGKSTAVQVYDENTKSLVATFKSSGMYSLGHSNRVCCVKYLTDRNLLVSGGWDNTLFFWDIREGKNVGWLHGPHICGDSIDVRGDTLLTGSYDNKNVLQLWSVSERKLIETVNWSPEVSTGEQLGFLYTAGFDRMLKGNEYIVAGGGGLNELRIFAQSKTHPLIGKVTFTKPVTSSDCAYTANYVAVGATDGFVRIFGLDKATKTGK
jgi:COMPASS component SWD3